MIPGAGPNVSFSSSAIRRRMTAGLALCSRYQEEPPRTGASGQPILTADGSGVLTYNAEVYNYRELRQELDRSISQFGRRGSRASGAPPLGPPVEYHAIQRNVRIRLSRPPPRRLKPVSFFGFVARLSWTIVKALWCRLTDRIASTFLTFLVRQMQKRAVPGMSTKVRSSGA